MSYLQIPKLFPFISTHIGDDITLPQERKMHSFSFHMLPIELRVHILGNLYFTDYRNAICSEKALAQTQTYLMRHNPAFAVHCLKHYQCDLTRIPERLQEAIREVITCIHLRVPQDIFSEEIGVLASSLPKLQSLSLSGQGITFNHALTHFEHLKALCLSELTQEGIKVFPFLTRLEELYIKGSSLFLEDLGESLNHCPLRILHISDCTNVTHAGLHHLKCLESLIIEDCFAFKNHGIQEILSIPTLKRLVLGKMVLLSPEWFKKEKMKCHGLEELKIAHPSLVPEDEKMFISEVKNFIECLPCLQKVRIHKIVLFTLLELFLEHKELKILEIEGENRFLSQTELEALKKLQNRHPHLRVTFIVPDAKERNTRRDEENETFLSGLVHQMVSLFRR